MSEIGDTLIVNEKLNPSLTKNALVAHDLPTLTVSNMRSLFPKIRNYTLDFLERSVDVGICCEIWEKKEDKIHLKEIEHLLEMHGLSYHSSTRPTQRGGGTAVIVNSKRFRSRELKEIKVPSNLEVVWVLAKPVNNNAEIKNIILCSFYSPPHARSKLKNELADHIVGTLSMLTVKYENSAIFVCGDRNNFDITPLLNNSLKLKQIVSLPTRKNKILDICITNMSKYYNTPSIVSPVEPDDLNNGVPSDHSVPFCVPHTDPSKPPKRQWKKVVFRPLPESKINEFGKWILTEKWTDIDSFDDPNEKLNSFLNLVHQKLDRFFPKKVVKFNPQDKPFMTHELKKLKRKRMRIMI